MKRVVLTILQILIAAALFYLILRDEDTRRQIGVALQEMNLAMLLVGVVFMWAIICLMAFRWWILVRVHGIKLAYGRAAILGFIGQFFSMILPGGTAGDVIKIFYVTQETEDKKTAAFLSVLMDRIVGLTGLIVFVCIVIALRWEWYMQSEPEVQRVVWFFLGFLVLATGGLAFSFLITGLGLVEKLPDWFPLRGKFIDLAAAYHVYAKSWKSTLGAMCVSVCTHILFCLLYQVGAWAIGVRFAVLDMLSIAPIVNAISAVPLTPGGVGVREKFFEMLAPLAGVSEGQAVIISISGYGMMVVGSLLGGLFFALYRPSGMSRVSMETMREQVHEVEEEAQHEEEEREADSSHKTD